MQFSFPHPKTIRFAGIDVQAGHGVQHLSSRMEHATPRFVTAVKSIGRINALYFLPDGARALRARGFDGSER